MEPGVMEPGVMEPALWSRRYGTRWADIHSV